VAAAKAATEAVVAERLRGQRETLEAAKLEAVNGEKAKTFAERQKLEEKLAGLQRQLQAKTAGELGEGAELDLFETLRAEFPHDRFSRLKKGTAGADIAGLSRGATRATIPPSRTPLGTSTEIVLSPLTRRSEPGHFRVIPSDDQPSNGHSTIWDGVHSHRSPFNVRQDLGNLVGRRPAVETIGDTPEVVVVLVASVRLTSHADRIPMPHQDTAKAAGTSALVPKAPRFQVHPPTPKGC